MRGDGEKTTSFPSSAIDPSALELIHAGARHKLYRGLTAGYRFVAKLTGAELSQAEAVDSLRHEYELLRGLDLPGIVRVLGLSQTGNGLALVMEDAGGSTLAREIRSRPLPVTDFLDVAIQLADAIALLHEAQIVHRDVNLGNMIWNVDSRRVTLGDFASAMPVSALASHGAARLRLQGSLVYISPEQTGRTGRTVDSRTDLYSLGISFYQLLTGTPPFTASDPVELVHAHIARRPVPAHERNPDVPITLSRIVLKLLEKEPEQRYQSAEALAMDLRDAQGQWRANGTILPFPIAQHDIPRELRIADTLYGREEEQQALLDAFARARLGGRELVLITGAPGIGKSALVGHFDPAIAGAQGFYISGKFDQLQRSVPFSGLAQAFRELVRQLLVESEPVLAFWRQRIEAAIAPNGQVLVDIVPELGRILGPQAAVPVVGPVESKNRLNLVFASFLRVFAGPEHPLVLFLDDLQWADAASLQLLQQWLADIGSHHLLVIGAYRDADVSPSHPLALSLAQMRDLGIRVGDIHLQPIGTGDVAKLISESLKDDVATAMPLAELVMRKTAGNPFFVRRLLQLLQSQQLIRFGTRSRKWEWDLAELERAPVADNVLDLMVQAINSLPEQTRALLETAACVGHRFDLDVLAELSGLSRAEAGERLWPALKDGLALAVRKTYSRAPSDALASEVDTLPQMIQFAHDRVQQAAYSMMSEEHRRDMHLGIGRHLLETKDDIRLAERLFEIVDQFELGGPLIADPAERLRLAQLNLAAGRKARASAAYDAAADYLTSAMRHLSETSWLDQPDLTFAVHRELAECAYLTGQHGQAEEIIETALEHAPTRIARVDLYSLRVLAATVASDWSRALRWGREGLAVLDQQWPLEGLTEAIEAEAAAVMVNVGDRRFEDLRDEPEVADAEIRACMRLLSILGPPAYFSGADVLSFLMTRATNLSLIHGPSPYSAFACALYAAIHNARTGAYDRGYAFGRLALGLAQRFGNRAEECRALEVFSLVVHPWKAPLRESLPLVREGFRAGIESGELAYAAFNLNSVLINGAPAGMPVAELLVDADRAMEFARQHKNRTSAEMAVPFRQLAQALAGLTQAPAVLDDDSFREQEYLEEAKGNQTALGFFWVAKLQAAYLLGDYETAYSSSQAGVGPLLAGNLGMVTSVDHVFYTALTVSAQPMRSPGGISASLEELRQLQEKLVSWAGNCPENFAHKADLIAAEIAKLAGLPVDAMRLYRLAIDGASRNAYIQDEAIAHERRARFLLGEHEPELAAAHIKAARERYHRWGATAKVRAIGSEYPGLVEPEFQMQAPGYSIDALALIRASQAIAVEREPNLLFGRILRVLAEVAGAQSGALVLLEAEVLTVRARIDMNDAVTVSPEETPLDQRPDLPGAILRYVLRSREPLVLADAGREEAFAMDPAVRLRKVRSVICVPLKSQAKVVGVIYLENQTMAGAFADELVEVVQVLAAQATISLENSALVDALQTLTGSLEARVAERTRQLDEESMARDKAEAALLQAQKMEAMGSLTGGVAHDFNNLLTPIMGSLDMLQRKGVGGEREQRLIANALLSAERARTLIQRLLAFARRQPLQMTAVDIGGIVAGMAALLDSTLGPRIEIVVDVNPDLPPAQVDANQIEMALLNLAVNARDAMADGGVLRISGSLEHVSGDNAFNLKAAHYVRLSVRDTGAGMDETTLGRAVEPFFSTKGVGKGTGLGLSMVHGLASQLGGSLTIKSELGVGTEVVLWLPVSSVAGVVPATVSEAVEACMEAAGTVLLVDDEDAVRMSTADMLSGLGYTVVEASSGEEAIDLLKDGPRPDLLVTDHLMPGINGAELARLVRRKYSTVQILLISGYAESEGVAFDLPRLTKPFLSNELAASLAVLREPKELR